MILCVTGKRRVNGSSGGGEAAKKFGGGVDPGQEEGKTDAHTLHVERQRRWRC